MSTFDSKYAIRDTVVISGLENCTTVIVGVYFDRDKVMYDVEWVSNNNIVKTYVDERDIISKSA